MQDDPLLVRIAARGGEELETTVTLERWRERNARRFCCKSIQRWPRSPIPRWSVAEMDAMAAAAVFMASYVKLRPTTHEPWY